MEIKAKCPAIALFASVVAIGILFIRSLVVVVPLFYLLVKSGCFSGSIESFIKFWSTISIICSFIPSKKNHAIVINL